MNGKTASVTEHAFTNEYLPLEERVRDLVGKLSLEEKFGLLAGDTSWSTMPVPRLGMGAYYMTDGPHGVGPHSSGGAISTYFPVGICRAATWNPGLMIEFGVSLAQEVRSIGYHMILGPGVNILRTPMCGRNFEYQAEDPYLNKRLIVPAVQGIQSQRISACVKHYACNNQEHWRIWVNTIVSRRALEEIYLPAFKAAVTEADAWSVMACYNLVNGLYGCESEFLLREKLIDSWGFRGFVVSDWGAMDRVENVHRCIKARMSLEMPSAKKYVPAQLKQMLDQGKFTLAELDDCISRLVRVMFLVGMFDPADKVPKGSRNSPYHQDVARRIAEEGIVLLKNEHRVLPLDKSRPLKIAVIGPNANVAMGYGGGSSNVNPPYEITPLAGITECGGKNMTITGDVKTADAVIVVAGLNHKGGNDSEGSDRSTFDLPADQVSLIENTVAANQRTIVVLVSGTPVNMLPWVDKVPAVVEAWYAGQEAGRAIGKILFGDVNPSGKLPVTFPRKLSDNSAHASAGTYPGIDDEDSGPTVKYDEGIFVGYRHFDAKGIEPMFPFGHGLSYASFAYSNLVINTPRESTGAKAQVATVSVDVSNTGPCPGSEVIQMYISDVETSVPRPPKELKGFQKVNLVPGQVKTVTFTIEQDALSFFDEGTNQWRAEDGTFMVLVGSSSGDIRLQGEITYKST